MTNTNSTKPKISVLGASYNHKAFIEKAVDSVLQQEEKNFEFILIDDASSDGTQEILQQYSDPRLRLILHEKNQGVCRTYNEAYSHAQGEYIALMSGDDICFPERLRVQKEYLDENPDVLALFTPAVPIGENGRILQIPALRKAFKKKQETRESFLRKTFNGENTLFAPTEMLRRSAMDNEPYFYDIRCRQTQDWDQHIRIALKGDIRVLDTPLMFYRTHENNLSKPSPKVYSCSACEQIMSLEHFLRIQTPDLLKKIFPEAAQIAPPKAEYIPYVLARLAIESKSLSTMLWGIQLFGDLAADEEKMQFLEKNLNFTLSDYYKVNESLSKFWV